MMKIGSMSNQSRKDRIEDEVIVDCYDEYEMAMGWFYYLHDNLNFPFKASILENGKISSLQKGDVVKVTELVNSDENDVSIYNFVATVGIEKDEHIYDIPLEMIRGIDCDEGTCEVIEDWRYWCEKF
ncbi:calcium-binding protein [bacterium]|nr:calcium-binding protein [bacterium]MBU1959412.1 calcium-binding protein [bacterium]